MDERPPDPTINFLTVAYGCFGHIIVQLARDLGGKFSNETLAIIHGQLQKLSDASIDVPEHISALRQIDLLAAMFPPPRQEE